LQILIKDLHVLATKMEHIKQNMLQSLRRDKELATKLKNNSCVALGDLNSGKVFDDDIAAQNFRNSIEDVLKVSGMTALFILPGGSIGLITLRKLLQTDIAAKVHIEKLLTLSVAESPNSDV